MKDSVTSLPICKIGLFTIHSLHCHYKYYITEMEKSLENINCFKIRVKCKIPVATSSILISSVQFSRSVMSNSLWPHKSQHARPPCPSSPPGVYSNSCPLNQWCHPTISPSVFPFSSCLQSFPASGSFPMSQLFAWSGQSTGVSASTSVLPMNTRDWSPLRWTGWISLLSKGLSRVLSNTTVQFLTLKKKKSLWFRTSRFASAWVLSSFYWLRVAGQCWSAGSLRQVSIWAWAEDQDKKDES